VGAGSASASFTCASQLSISDMVAGPCLGSQQSTFVGFFFPALCVVGAVVTTAPRRQPLGKHPPHSLCGELLQSVVVGGVAWEGLRPCTIIQTVKKRTTTKILQNTQNTFIRAQNASKFWTMCGVGTNHNYLLCTAAVARPPTKPTHCNKLKRRREASVPPAGS
jgi:hypothetical protein